MDITPESVRFPGWRFESKVLEDKGQNTLFFGLDVTVSGVNMTFQLQIGKPDSFANLTFVHQQLLGLLPQVVTGKFQRDIHLSSLQCIQHNVADPVKVQGFQEQPVTMEVVTLGRSAERQLKPFRNLVIIQPQHFFRSNTEAVVADPIGGLFFHCVGVITPGGIQMVVVPFQLQQVPC